MKLHRETYAYIGIGVLALLVLVAFPESTSRLSAIERNENTSKAFQNLKLQAQAVYVYDMAEHQMLFAKNENTALPLASLTKVMTTLAAASLAPHSTLVELEQKKIELVHASSTSTTTTKIVRTTIDHWQLKDLLEYTLVASSNDGAAAIARQLGLGKSGDEGEAEQAFVEKMNEYSKMLGLKSMRFLNSTGLDITTTRPEAGAYGSAQDVAKMMEHAITKYPDIFGTTKYASVEFQSEDNVAHKAQNTNTLANTIPGLIAGKTGYTTLAGGNLAVVFDAGIQHPIIIVVLGSTYDGRFSDVDDLVQASIDTVALQ
jgi:D-alanyl-D-alanine carboxypeptidase